jgi:hypothetical protein
MVTKYDYLSTCCGTEYSETRLDTDPAIYTTCVQCGQGEYTLISETALHEKIVEETPVDSEQPA